MIEAILDECLADIQVRHATIEDCLRKFPQHAGELKPLLEVALAIGQVPEVKPSEAFKRATRARLFDRPNGTAKGSPGASNSEADPSEAGDQDEDNRLRQNASEFVASFRAA